MEASQVIFGDRSIMDLTSDTVTPNVVKKGYTFHAANGERLVGTMEGEDELLPNYLHFNYKNYILPPEVPLITYREFGWMYVNATTNELRNTLNIKASEGVKRLIGLFSQTTIVTNNYNFYPITFSENSKLIDVSGIYQSSYIIASNGLNFSFPNSVKLYCRAFDNANIYVARNTNDDPNLRFDLDLTNALDIRYMFSSCRITINHNLLNSTFYNSFTLFNQVNFADPNILKVSEGVFENFGIYRLNYNNSNTLLDGNKYYQEFSNIYMIDNTRCSYSFASEMFKKNIDNLYIYANNVKASYVFPGKITGDSDPYTLINNIYISGNDINIKSLNISCFHNLIIDNANNIDISAIMSSLDSIYRCSPTFKEKNIHISNVNNSYFHLLCGKYQYVDDSRNYNTSYRVFIDNIILENIRNSSMIQVFSSYRINSNLNFNVQNTYGTSKCAPFIHNFKLSAYDCTTIYYLISTANSPFGIGNLNLHLVNCNTYGMASDFYAANFSYIKNINITLDNCYNEWWSSLRGIISGLSTYSGFNNANTGIDSTDVAINYRFCIKNSKNLAIGSGFPITLKNSEINCNSTNGIRSYFGNGAKYTFIFDNCDYSFTSYYTGYGGIININTAYSNGNSSAIKYFGNNDSPSKVFIKIINSKFLINNVLANTAPLIVFENYGISSYNSSARMDIYLHIDNYKSTYLSNIYQAGYSSYPTSTIMKGINLFYWDDGKDYNKQNFIRASSGTYINIFCNNVKKFTKYRFYKNENLTFTSMPDGNGVYNSTYNVNIYNNYTTPVDIE